MDGREYMEDIRTNLESGRNQWRMGENVLGAFGYVRRRKTAIDEINATIEDLGLVANPPVSSEMPLRSPRIRFSLRAANGTVTPATVNGPDMSASDAPAQDDVDDDFSPPEPAFSVSELASANRAVKCVSPSGQIQEAYTEMLLGKYSQLVVASSATPRQQDIKGIVSFQSIAKALMNGRPETVNDCIDGNVRFAQRHDDLKSVVGQLAETDVVLVIGRDNRLQGIVTAWDLAEEFARLIEPFKRIGEIEIRLRALLKRRLGKDKVAHFLSEQGLSGDGAVADLDDLTMGSLHSVFGSPDNWSEFGLPFDRKVFTGALNDVRKFRNRLMHFKDSSKDKEEEDLKHLTNFCETVREIQLDSPQ